MRMRIHTYIQVLALLAATSCGQSEPSNDQGAKADPVANQSDPEAKTKQSKEDTKPEVRYYLLSEQ